MRTARRPGAHKENMTALSHGSCQGKLKSCRGQDMSRYVAVCVFVCAHKCLHYACRLNSIQTTITIKAIYGNMYYNFIYYNLIKTCDIVFTFAI